jgi:hypothetical protein
VVCQFCAKPLGIRENLLLFTGGIVRKSSLSY